MAKYFDGFGKEVTAMVETLISDNERLKRYETENKALKTEIKNLKKRKEIE